MKRMGFVLSLLFSAYAMQAQVKSADELIRKVFASLQAKDEKAFLSLCPASAQLVQVMKNMAQGVISKIEAYSSPVYSPDLVASSDRSLKKVRSILQKTYSEKAIQKIKQSFRDNFRSIIKNGAKREVDWTATTFTNYKLDSIKTGNFLYGQTLYEHSGYQSFGGSIYFKEGGSICQIDFKDFLFIPEENSWYAGTLIWLILPGDEVVTVTSTSTEDVPPPPPKPKSKKTSAKKKRPPKS